ncbi:hypothetical protein [Pandoraea anhela]|uniref:Uncharacterized protein n=1 Tax=Pandoraea anhela TaxID=2508295 RepID=A0A5E4VK34_9BURK|nr:hypothetical protein [Pandoraea anhela]VVE12658.1 hypothetical protein PAN31108_02706 [Pandoraea anhela]
MPRSSPHFDRVTLGLLHAAARQAHATHHDSKTAFLEQFIRDALSTTRRLHSAQTYLRLLAEAGVERLPSAGTVQRAITRVRNGMTGAAQAGAVDPKAAGHATTLDATQQALAQHVAWAMALLSPEGGGALSTSHAGELPFDAAHAYCRLQRLEGENRALRVRAETLTAMLMAARVALAEALSHPGRRSAGEWSDLAGPAGLPE